MTNSTQNASGDEIVIDPVQAKAARRRLLLIVACFAIPLLLAMIWLQVVRMQGGTFGTTTRGELVHPALPLKSFSLNQFIMKNDGKTAEEAYRESAEPFTEEGFRKIWSVLYLPEGECLETCEKNLYHTRQVRLLLNSRMNRLQRVVVMQTPGQISDIVLAAHLGLHVLTGKAQDIAKLRDQIKAAEASRGLVPMRDAIYVVDPFGNLMMRFDPDMDPGKMLKDLKHLLKVSRIG